MGSGVRENWLGRRKISRVVLKEERIAECLVSWGDCLRRGDRVVRKSESREFRFSFGV